jgi:hypothetical protein
MIVQQAASLGILLSQDQIAGVRGPRIDPGHRDRRYLKPISTMAHANSGKPRSFAGDFRGLRLGECGPV